MISCVLPPDQMKGPFPSVVYQRGGSLIYILSICTTVYCGDSLIQAGEQSYTDKFANVKRKQEEAR